MTTAKDCPHCQTGVIRPHEIAQGHDRCGDCRIRAIKEAEQEQKQNALNNANRRAMK